MKPILSIVAVAVFGAAFCSALQQAQQVSWAPQDQLQQYAAVPRQPIAADLQNQVNALSAQLASANRQLQYFQQQLSMIQPQSQVQAQPQLQPQSQQQLQLSTQQQLAFQQQQQQQQQTLQQVAPQQHYAQQQQVLQSQPQPQPQQQQQQQPQPIVSSLVDEADLATDPRYNTQSNRLFQQQQAQQQAEQQAQQQAQQIAQQRAQQQQLAAQAQAPQLTSPFQQQQQQQQAPTSTTVGPPSIEQPSFEAAAPAQQAPSANQAPPHNPPRNDDKFAIGLGVLSPGYTQKFGNTALDFNQDKNGFSFTLSNNGHSNQPQTVKPAATGAN